MQGVFVSSVMCICVQGVFVSSLMCNCVEVVFVSGVSVFVFLEYSYLV